MKPSLATRIGALKLDNPVLMASGTFGYGDEITDLVSVGKLGGIITKTITLQPRPGNPPPRICEVTGGMINAIGLQNIGAERFLQEKLPALRALQVNIIVSIAGNSVEEYVRLAHQLDGVRGIAGIELNLSCPNLQKKIISQDPKLVRAIVAAVSKASRVPVIAKLSPQVTDIVAMAEIAMTAGATAVSLINTFPAMAIDIATRKPKIAFVTGGLSGPAIKPMAVRAVWEVYRALKAPIIGGGGIMTAEDAVEFLLAGASAVSVGTANFIDPGVPEKIVSGLRSYMERYGIINIKELVGSVRC
ncbi:MAG: dihydroorotate dehydrogenase [Elusimicrobia bacterium]|nr:dihydroorotate dehydrogenase [Elusimicrobiota bacterium]